MSGRLARITIVWMAWLGGFVSMACNAQPTANFPTKPVRVIVPYAPGGATDIIARFVSVKLNELWNVPVIIDNRSGASGAIALEATAKATPDGYTLLVGNVTTNAITETTLASALHIKPSQDLMGVTNLIEIPHALLAYPGFPATNVRQLVDYAKANTGKINYGSAGVGSYPHLDMLLFSRAAGIDMNHVPYKAGAAGFVTALISNEIQIVFGNLASTLEHVRANRIKALAVTMAARIPELPNVATMTEQGFPGIGTNAWNGMFAPVGLPAPVLERIYKSVLQIMERPDMKETLAKQMMTVSLSKSPRAYSDFIKTETRKWASVIKENNVKIE